MAIFPDRAPHPRGTVVATPPENGAIPPTAEEAQAANTGRLAPGPTRSFVESLARNWAFRLGGGAVAAAGAYAVYENVPAFHEPFDFEKLKTEALGATLQFVQEKGPTLVRFKDSLLGQTIPISDDYNPNAEKGVIKVGVNATPIAENQFSSTLTDQETSNGKPVIVFPLEVGPNQRIDYSTITETFEVGNSDNPGVTSEKRVDFGKRLIVPNKGTKIIVPVEQADISTSTTSVQGKEYLGTLAVHFIAPDRTPYTLVIRSKRDVRELVAEDSMIDPSTGKLRSSVSLDGGTPIARTNFENAEVDFTLIAFPTKKGEPKDPRTKYSDFDFATTNVGGKSKVVILPK